MRPYPYERWPRLSRAEVDALRTEARGGAAAALRSGAAGASEWLGATVRVEIAGAPAPWVPPLADPVVAVLLEDPQGDRAALLLDPPIASALVDRTVGGDGDAEEAAGPLRDLERGVLAYAIARWIAGRSSYRVAAVLTSIAALSAGLDGALVRVPLELTLGDARGPCALLAPRRAGSPPPPRLPRWARELPIEHVVTAGEAILSAREIASLEAGDVVIPDRCGLAIRGGLAGEVRLAAPRARRSFVAAIEDGGLRIGRTEPSVPTHAPEVSMTEDPKRLLEAMGETPVTLTLELARFTIALADATALAEGEVVRTGRPIGGSVALRAGDRVIARGELVDVDGEIGVRIVELGE